MRVYILIRRLGRIYGQVFECDNHKEAIDIAKTSKTDLPRISKNTAFYMGSAILTLIDTETRKPKTGKPNFNYKR